MTEALYDKVEKKGLSCSFYVVVEQADINKKSENLAREYFKNNTPRGFRQGKVPKSYGVTEFRSSALTRMISESVQAKIEELKLQLFVEPDIDLIENDPEKDVVCKVDAISIPELDLEKFSKSKAKIIKCQVPDAEVNTSYSRLVDDFSEWNKIDSELVNGKGAQITVNGLDEAGKKLKLRFDFNEKPDELYIQRVLRATVESSKIEAKEHEKCTAKLYEAFKNLAGKSAGHVEAVKSYKEIELQLDEVCDLVQPELTTEFLQGLGVPDGKEESLHKSLRELLEYQTRKKMEEYAYFQFDKFCAKDLNFDVPASLVEKELQKNSEADKSQIEKNLKLNLALSALIRQGEVKIDEQRVAEEISHQYQSMYGAFGSDNHKMRSIIEDYAKNTVATNQAIEFAFTKMTQEEQEVDYSELDNFLKDKMD